MPKPVAARLDPFQNIVNCSSLQPLVIAWTFQPESILPGPPTGGGYHFRDDFGATSPHNITLADGRVGVLAGTFPTVSDVIFNPGPGVIYISHPWWFFGPNTDTDPSIHAGYNFYDIDGPNASFSHTWTFHGYTFTFGSTPAHFAPAGSLSASFGPVTFTVEDVPWTLVKIHVALTAIAESEQGASPTNMGSQPFFSATFRRNS
jgi:hypothetical protein